MEKLLQFIAVLLLIGGLLGGLPEAYASHLVGTEMTYTALGANQYRVQLRMYGDCSGTGAGPITLECRNGGCGSAAALSVPLVQQNTLAAASPLCPTAGYSCGNPSGPIPLYDYQTYEATVTLAPGQWVLSSTVPARGDLGNFVNASAANNYAEALLDNRGSNVANTSPQFDPANLPVQYVCVNQVSTIAFPATDPDGDSLVYTLAAPLSGCNQPMAFKPYPGASGGVVIVTRVPLCVLELTGLAGGSNYTPQLPMPVAIDTTGSYPIKTGVPYFRFNQSARTITLKPNSYVPNLPASNGSNKHQLAILVSEYRYVNGVRRLVGQVRREVLLVVVDCGTNTVPGPGMATTQNPNSGTLTVNAPDTTQLTVLTCSYSRVRLAFTDPDNLRTPSAHQTLTVSVPADINSSPHYLDAGNVGTFAQAGNGTENPTATFHFQPTPAMAGRLIRIVLRIEDNACPVKGVQTRVVLIRVVKGNPLFILAPNGLLYAGSGSPALPLAAYYVRPDSVRDLATGTTLPQSYTYAWRVQGDGLNPANATSSMITVAPTMNSRYFLRISPTNGAGCDDTTSILVQTRLATPTVTRTGTTLTSSALTGNQWYRDGQLLPGATARTLVVTASGAYTVRVTLTVGTATYYSAFSTALTVLAAQASLPGTSLSVAPNPTPDGRLSVGLTGYQQPVELRVLDALGHVLLRTALPAPNPLGTTQALDLAPLRPSLYLLQVRTATSLETRRIVRE